MSANPWDKFFWNDWENDPALKLCGLAAQGLWMRMLCICAKADPKGYLLVAGQPLSAIDLASLVGKHQGEIETLLFELAAKGVFSRDRKDRIYSRRMVRDVTRSNTGRQNGKLGGNPSLGKDEEKVQGVNPIPNPHKPEAIIQREETKCTKPADRRLSYPSDFEQFWREYPVDRLMSKKQALAAWARLCDEDRAAATRSLPAFKAHCRQHPDYRPVHAVRYLSQRRFDGFIILVDQAAKTFYARHGSKQWHAWEQYYRSTWGKTPPQDANQGWRFPSEWPPSEVEQMIAAPRRSRAREASPNQTSLLLPIAGRNFPPAPSELQAPVNAEAGKDVA